MQRDLDSETLQRRSAEASGSGCQHKDTCQYHVTRSVEPAIKVPLQIFYDMAKDIAVFTELCQPAWQAFVYFFKIKQLNIRSYLFCHLHVYTHCKLVYYLYKITARIHKCNIISNKKRHKKVCFSWPKQTKNVISSPNWAWGKKADVFHYFFFIEDIWMQETITQSLNKLSRLKEIELI